MVRLALLFVLSLPLLGLVGWGYGWANVHSPIVGWSSVLFVLLLAGAAALIPWWLARPLKVRSTVGLRTVAVANGLVALYLAWGSFAWALHDWVLVDGAPELMSYWTEPATIWDTAVGIAPVGWFEIATLRPAGILLWTLWAFEALAVLALPAVVAPLRVADRSFCTTCRRWYVDQKPVRIPADQSSLAIAVRHDGLAAVRATAAPSHGANKWVRVDLRHCPGCGSRLFAIGQEITATVAGGRGTATAIRPLRPWAAVDAETDRHLERIRDLLRAADTARFEAFKAGHRLSDASPDDAYEG